MLARAGFAASMPRLDGLVAAWVAEGDEPSSATWREAHALAGQMLACWPVHATANAQEGRSAQGVMLNHLVRLQDREHIDAMLAGVVAAGAYAAGDNAAIVQALKLLATPAWALLLGVVRGNADLHIGGCADLLARAAAVSAWRGQLQGAAKALLDAMPGDPARPRRRPTRGAASGPTQRWFTTRCAPWSMPGRGLAALADQAVTQWLAWPKTYGMEPSSFRRCAASPSGRRAGAPAGLRLRAAALAHLQARPHWIWRRRPTGDATPG